MGMSVNIWGVRDLSKQFRLMMNVKIACDLGKIDYPKDIYDFFGPDAYESEEYLAEKMETIKIEFDEPNIDDIDRYEVDLLKLPEDVKKIRFDIGC